MVISLTALLFKNRKYVSLELMKFLKKTVAIVIGINGFLAATGLLLIEKVDRRPYQELSIYRKTIDGIQVSGPSSNHSQFLAGWASENITPSYPIEVAGYGLREKALGTIDSVYIYAFVVSNGISQAVLISGDLLIFPPTVVKKLLKDLPEGFSEENIFFTASHSHNSPGGWMEGLAAGFIAGETDIAYIEKITKATKNAISAARKNLHPVSLQHGSFQLPQFVKNRINSEGEKHATAYLLRASSPLDTALIFTYAAHANTYSRTIDSISRDFPGNISDEIKKQKLASFAQFCAGPVGSMGNDCGGRPDKECRELIAEKFTEKIKNSPFESITNSELKSGKFRILLKEPAYRISTNYRLRPWFFSLLMGEQESFITFLKIGNLIFMGTPCDFSGELALELEKEAKKLNLKLVITSFNGSYIGYVTPDRYCDIQHHESIDMNWSGTGTGSFFKDVILTLLRQLALDDEK